MSFNRLLFTLLFIGLSFIPVAAVDQTLTLGTGFNFIALTVTPDTELTSQTLLGNDGVDSVFKFDAATQQFVFNLKLADGRLFGSSFTLHTGSGYVIKASADVQTTIGGTAFDISEYTVVSGFNFVGTAGITTDITTTALLANNSGLSSIFSWNSTGQLFDFVIRVNDKPFGNQFSLANGLGYFVNISGPGTLSLTGQGTVIKSLTSLTLDPAVGVAITNGTLDLTTVTATAGYSDQSNATVNASWTADVGTVTGNSWTAPGTAQTATLTASYTENQVTRTATLTVTVSATTTATSSIPAPTNSVADLTLGDFTKKVLIAANLSGGTEASLEALGTLPASQAAGTPRFAPLPSDGLSRIKDRALSFALPGGPARSPARAITHSDSTYSFKTGDANAPVTVNANLVYGSATSKSLIYLQQGLTPTVDWTAVGAAFDTEIYGKTVAGFGAPPDTDLNGQVVILYYDMGDAEKSTLGYFYSADLVADYEMNNMEIFYMNITWSADAGSYADPTSGDMKRTLAHEFQHMINYGVRQIRQTPLPEMDTWLNEALAESSEHYVLNSPGDGRITTFTNDRSDKLKNGASLCVWGDDDESYALVYMFMQYCRLQATDGAGIYKQLINYAGAGDYTAIEAIMKAQNSKFTSFRDLVFGWRMANLINGDGIFGYGVEKTTFNLTTAGGVQPPASTSNLSLNPGGSIYIYPSATDLTNFTPSGQFTNVQYLRINP